MAYAAGRALDATFLRQLAREREQYAMPARLHELTERFARRTLALLSPHFAAEVGGRAGDVVAELAELEAQLAGVLRLPETYCPHPTSYWSASSRRCPTSARHCCWMPKRSATGTPPRTRSTR